MSELFRLRESKRYEACGDEMAFCALSSAKGMDVTMANNKINRINDDIQRVLSTLLRSVKDPRVQQGMISVTRVDTTGDLRYCKVYLSVLGDIDEKQFNKGVKSASGWLRRELGASLTLRYTPELIFELDKSISHGAHINEVINSLDIRSGREDDDESQ